MTEKHSFPTVTEHLGSTNLSKADYQSLYKASIEDPEKFWTEQAKQFVSWDKPWSKVSDCDFKQGQIQWFLEGSLNVSYNCLDRHLATRGNQTAIIWEGDDPNQQRTITYQELYDEVCRFANALINQGIKTGDRVCIYLPMIPEAAVAMLACARIGAIHSVVFGGFSAESLRDRLNDADCRCIITADEGRRGGKTYPLKQNADKAIENCPQVSTVFVIKNTGKEIPWNSARDIWYDQTIAGCEPNCPPVQMDAEAPLFILYTSGSTGKPKGILHTTGGYLVYSAMTHQYAFDYREGDIYWCTADIGWITGHSYIVYGPLCNGATTLMFEGVPTYPDASRFWQVVDKHKVNIFYTAPTAIRALISQGDEYVTTTSRKSLRVLGTVGEPINPEAWEWYYHVIGESRCPIIDTWWQTETGGFLITPLPGSHALKPGSATLPFFGVEPGVVDNEGKLQDGPCEGILVIKNSWPGQARTIYGDHKRFLDTYFANFPGNYFPGDGVRRDEDGYYWITGRVDDVINVSGHRLGTAEIESALVLHDSVAEAAVVGYPHEIKGQGIYAYVTLKVGYEASDTLQKSLILLVREEIGPIATPDIIQWAPRLPKTRSGKIMRRILRKVAADEIDSLGDISTLADPSVVEEIIENHKKI